MNNPNPKTCATGCGNRPNAPGGMFCSGCATHWEVSPERQQANDLGRFGQARLAYVKAMAVRLAAAGQLPPRLCDECKAPLGAGGVCGACELDAENVVAQLKVKRFCTGCTAPLAANEAMLCSDCENPFGGAA